MKFNIQYIILALLVLAVASCTSYDELVEIQEENNPFPAPPGPFDPGSLDLSNYVAIGNSVTSGFADAALSPAGQMNSLPGMIADQLSLAGAGNFVYPPISSGFGFGGVNADGSIRGRSFIDIGAAAVDPSQAIQFKTGSALVPSSVSTSDLNNFGVPGARVVDIVTQGYGMFNPYYGNFMSSAAASVLEDAISAGPTFFTLWIGSNDVLGYAGSGGSGGEDFDPLDRTTLTDVASFTAAFSATLDALQATGAEGAVLNLPPVTILPFFQTVTALSPTGYEFITINDSIAGVLNAGYAEYNGAMQIAANFGLITAEELASRTIAFEAGSNPAVITDESLTVVDLGTGPLPQIRLATALDIYPLTASAVIGQPSPDDPTQIYGVTTPIPDQYTLTFPEQVNVVTRTAQFNGVISALVGARNNVSLVDVHPVFADAFGLTPAQATALALTPAGIEAADGELGIDVDGFSMVPLSLDASALFNSIFSTDGIHPNPRGAAIIGNEIIDQINADFGAEIPSIDVLAQPGIFVEGL